MKKQLRALPEIGACLSNPEMLPSESADLILSFPKFVAPANLVAALLRNRDEPPPTPRKADEILGGFATARLKSRIVASPHWEEDEGGRPSTGYYYFA